MKTSFPLTRRALVAGAVGTALSAPMIGRSAFAFAAAPGRSYSRRAVDLVASSLVIDMLAPLKITMSPDYVAHRLTDAEAAEFRASSITGFHNAYGPRRARRPRAGAGVPRRLAGLCRAQQPCLHPRRHRGRPRPC